MQLDRFIAVAVQQLELDPVRVQKLVCDLRDCQAFGCEDNGKVVISDVALFILALMSQPGEEFAEVALLPLTSIDYFERSQEGEPENRRTRPACEIDSNVRDTVAYKELSAALRILTLGKLGSLGRPILREVCAYSSGDDRLVTLRFTIGPEQPESVIHFGAAHLATQRSGLCRCISIQGDALWRLALGRPKKKPEQHSPNIENTPSGTVH